MKVEVITWESLIIISTGDINRGVISKGTSEKFGSPFIEYWDNMSNWKSYQNLESSSLY